MGVPINSCFALPVTNGSFLKMTNRGPTPGTPCDDLTGPRSRKTLKFFCQLSIAAGADGKEITVEPEGLFRDNLDNSELVLTNSHPVPNTKACNGLKAASTPKKTRRALRKSE